MLDNVTGAKNIDAQQSYQILYEAFYHLDGQVARFAASVIIGTSVNLENIGACVILIALTLGELYASPF